MRKLLTALVWQVVVGLAFTLAYAGETPLLAKARIINADGNAIGYAVITEGHDGVKIAVNLHSLPPGAHAFHIHGEGKCEAPDFKSATGHFNPFGREHGLKNPSGSHAGDLQNIIAGPDGTVSAVRLATLVTLAEGENSLLKPGGTAIVIHAGPDDNTSNPAGAAGPRIGCGVIKQAGKEKKL